MTDNSDLFIEKCIKIMPVLLVYSLVSIITYSYITYYTFDKNSEFNFSKGILFLIGVFFLIMVLVSHMLCVYVDPGHSEKSKLVELSEKENSNFINDYNESNYNECELFCKKCEYIRPMRAHHCKTCNKCIIKMDHHCPWIANCVGYYNHKYFYLFLFYTILGSLLAFCGLFPKFYEIDMKLNYYFALYNLIFKLFFTSDDETNSAVALDNINNTIEITDITNDFAKENIENQIMFENPFVDPCLIIISTILCLFTFVGVTVLFSLQTYLISNNLTSIENHKYRPKESSPYYKPDIFQNFKNLLGNNLALWLVPVFHKSKQNEEYFYLKSDSDIIVKDSNLPINNTKC